MTDKTTDIETNDDVSGLKANNTDLKSRLKKEQDKTRDLESRLSALESDRDDALDTSKSEHDKALGKLEKALEKANADLAARDTRLGELLIDNAIKDAITANKVLPEYVRFVDSDLRRGVKIVDGEAVTADGTPFAEARDAFFKSPEARAVVAAPNNGGAGATGSTTRTHTQLTKAPTNAQEMETFGHIVRDNPEQAKALAKGWGWPELNI